MQPVEIVPEMTCYVSVFGLPCIKVFDITFKETRMSPSIVQVIL